MWQRAKVLRLFLIATQLKGAQPLICDDAIIMLAQNNRVTILYIVRVDSVFSLIILYKRQSFSNTCVFELPWLFQAFCLLIILGLQ